MMILVDNAIKFTKQGEITVQVNAETRTPSEVWLHFRVSDTGIGIPFAKQETIFEPFTQADNSTTRFYGGSGLGLSIASQLVARMQGQLRVESEETKGSCFYFTACFGLVHGAPSAMNQTTHPLTLAR